MDKSLWGSRVQAPFGARVLWFVCCAPNHGFGPQSGLVQRGVLYAAAWGSENRTTALTGEEMQSPLWWLAPPPCPVGSMSLDSRVAGLPYESSSFATPAVRLINQKKGPFMGRLRAYFDQLAHPMQDVHSSTITRAYCRAIYEESVSRCFILPPLAGKSGAAG